MLELPTDHRPHRVCASSSSPRLQRCATASSPAHSVVTAYDACVQVHVLLRPPESACSRLRTRVDASFSSRAQRPRERAADASTTCARAASTTRGSTILARAASAAPTRSSSSAANRRSTICRRRRRCRLSTCKQVGRRRCSRADVRAVAAAFFTRRSSAD